MTHSSSSPTLARDLMNAEAIPLRPGKFPKDLAVQFLSGQYGGWPVVNASRKILGVVTELRLLQAISRVTTLDDLKVEDTMTAPVYVFDHDSLDVVLNMMVQRQVLKMPVVGGRELVGIISRGHVLRHCLPIPASSSREVPSCAWCERMHDASEGPATEKGWGDLSSFLSKNPLEFSDDISSTYCPSCLETIQRLYPSSRKLSLNDSEKRDSRPCLLVVDDDPSVAGMLTEVLQEWGYNVCVAGNGREGLDVVNGRPIDGILLDMQMPVMDGRTMLDELRWRGHQMPVLMMSGGSDERALRQLLQEGAQGFFLKPFHLSSLQQACGQIFQQPDVKEQLATHSHVA
jgi:two-component system, response regulator, stage 0 sporulation protein F